MNIKNIPINRPTSPTLFMAMALNAALPANTLVNQKLISKNEHKPTPSHPMNIWIKLFDVTKIIMKKVNRDK